MEIMEIIFSDKCSKFLSSVLLATFFSISFTSCSQMGPYMGIQPAVSYDIQGKVRDEVYISPDGTFQVRIPPLLKPGAKIRDKKVSDKLTALSLSDDLCREYALVEAAAGLDVSLDSYVENYLNSWTASSKSTILERKKMDTAFGGSLYVLAKVPQGAPCIQITFVDGKRKDEQPDSENAMLFIRSGGRIYHFSYALGPTDIWPAMKTGPREEVLMEFVAGFKQLK